MIAKDKIAIVKFIARKGTQLRFCALLPQEESYDEDHVQTPPGFSKIEKIPAVFRKLRLDSIQQLFEILKDIFCVFPFIRPYLPAVC